MHQRFSLLVGKFKLRYNSSTKQERRTWHLAITKIKTSTAKPVTMADLLEKSKSSIRNLSMGQRVKGIVIQKLSKSLILDIKGKAEGVVAEKLLLKLVNTFQNLK